MIEGIEILNKTEIFNYTNGMMGLIIGLFVCGFLSFAFFYALAKDVSKWFHIGTVAGVIMFISMFVLLFVRTSPTGRYQYEVTIDESVLFEDVLENYDVIGQKGKLWILEDKEK